MRMPRIDCPSCGRSVAVVPVDAIGLGAITDHKQQRRQLVLCPASETRVPLPGHLAQQQALADEGGGLPGHRAQANPGYQDTLFTT